MATYKGISGFNIKSLATDPSNLLEGEIWYNSTSGTLKVAPLVASWASGGTYPISSGDGAGAGTQTSAIVFGGKSPPAVNVSATYDGDSWTAGPTLGTARYSLASAKNGSQTAALATTGFSTSNTNLCESFDGSSWTEGPNYPVSQQTGDQGVGTQTAALISGGYGGPPGSAYLDATCTYDGTNWTALAAPSNLQDSRFAATATGTSTAAVMFSGIGGAAKVESWDGSTWSEQAEALTARTAGGSAGTSTDALYFGGEAGPGVTGVTEHWNGTSFSTKPAMATARSAPASCGTAALALATGGLPATNLTEAYTLAITTETVTTS